MTAAHTRATPPRTVTIAWLVILLITAVGCFEKPYTDRMQTTVRLFNYYDDLNRNLQGEANVDNFGIRIPKEFQQVAAPQPPAADPEKAEAEPPASTGVDERQPDYLGIQLPGLVATWKKEVQVDDESGRGTAYIYLLSNYRLFGVPEGQAGRIEPLKFQEHTVNLLAGDLGVLFKQDDWRREQHPANDLVQKVTYDALKFLPERPIADQKTVFDMYITSQSDIQAMVLVVYPDLIRPNEKLSERVKLALATLKVPPTAPSLGSPSGGASGGAAF